jgi:hypothetical protein
MPTYSKTVTFVIVGAGLGLLVWFGLVGVVRGASQEKPKRTVLTALPKIKSCVEHVKLVKAELVNQGDSQVAILELENQAYVGVISISVETTVDKDKYSVVWSAFSPDREPLIVIPPGGRAPIQIGNLAENSPIQIGGVMFSDGTEEGCELSLRSMRELKDFHTKKVGSQK